MAQIDLELIANIDKSVKQIEQFASASTKSLESVEQSFARLEKSSEEFGQAGKKSASILESAFNTAKVAAGAFLAVFAGRQILDFFSDSVKAAKEQEASIKQLNAALALTGDYSAEASDDMVKFANSIEDSTGFSDDQALSLIALAKSFGATNKQAQEIVKTSIDYASVTGKDVGGAVEGLSKSLIGVSSRLLSTDGQLQGLNESQLKAGRAIDILKEKYDGAAESLNKGFSGAVSRVSNLFEDVQKPIGSLITKNPIIVGSFNLIADALAKVSEYLEENKKAFIKLSVEGFDALASGVSALLSSLSFLGLGFDALKIHISTVQVIIATMVDVGVKSVNFLIDAFVQLVSLGIQPIIDPIVGIAEALNQLGIVGDDNLSVISNIAKKIAETAEGGVDALGGLIDATEGLKISSQESLDEAIAGYGSTTESIELAAQATFDFSQTIKKSGLEAVNTNDIFEKLNKTNKAAVINYKDQEKATDDLKKSFEDLQKSLQKADDERDPIAGYQREADARLKILQDSLAAGLTNEQEAADTRFNIALDAANKTAKENARIEKESLDKSKKRYEEFFNNLKTQVSGGLSSPLITPKEAEKIAGGKPTEADFAVKNADAIARTAGIIQASLEGAAGAAKLIGSAVGTIADAFLPGIGGAVSSIVSILGQGKDKVKELVDGFFKAIPDVVKGIVESAPIIMVALAENADEIIIALIKFLPQFVVAFVKAIPDVIKTLVKESIPALIEAIVYEVKRTFSQAIPFFSNGVRDAGVGFHNVMKNVAIFFEKTFNGEYFSQIKDKLVEGFQAGIDKSGEFFNSFGDAIANAADSFGSEVTKFTDLLGESIIGFKSVFIEVFEGFGNFLKAIPDGIANFAVSFKDAIAQGFGSLIQIGSNFGSIISNSLSNFGSLLAEKFSSIGNFFQGIGEKFNTGLITNLLSKISDGVKSLFSSLSIKLPEFKFPSFPEFKFPAFKWPSFPEFSFPKFSFPSLPELKIPKFSFPPLPEFKFPSFDLPKLSFDLPEIKIPSFDINFPDIGKTISSGVGKVKSFLGFAEGGYVPRGFPNDTFPARLTSGEFVIDNSLTDRLENYLNSQDKGGSSQPVKIVLQVGEKQLADVMLNINRQGFRLS